MCINVLYGFMRIWILTIQCMMKNVIISFFLKFSLNLKLHFILPTNVNYIRKGTHYYDWRVGNGIDYIHDV